MGLPVKRLLTITALLGLCGVTAGFAYQAAARERDYRALVARGDAALSGEHTFEAIEAYSGAIALRPGSMLAHLRRGETYRRRGDLEAAARDFRRAATIDPSATRPLEALGDALYERGRFARAVETYQERLRLDDASEPVTYKLALARYRAGNLTGATAAIQQALLMDQAHAEAFYLLGLCLIDSSRPSEAVAAFEKAVALSPGLIPAREELAALYATLNKRTDELEELQTIAGLDRTRPERQVELGLAQARHGQSELAVLTLGQALERSPGQHLVYSALGRVWLDIAVSRSETLPPLERRVALGKAVEALERVVPAADASSEVMTLYGRALLRNDQPEEAERVLQQATRRYPVDPAAFLAYASVAERQSHLDAARGALIEYGTLIVAEPDFAARARHIGTLSMRLNDPTTAAVWFERASAGRPGDVGLLADLAEAQLGAGRGVDAAATLARALERSPDNTRLLTMAGRARRPQ